MLINVLLIGVGFSHILDGASSLSDFERDQIDAQSQTVLKTCTYVLKNLRNAGTSYHFLSVFSKTFPFSVRLEKCSIERYEHRQEMVELVSAYLTSTSNVWFGAYIHSPFFSRGKNLRRTKSDSCQQGGGHEENVSPIRFIN